MGGEQRSRSEEKRIQVRVRCASPSAPVGLIKKASELSILCGTHVGIIVFSQARKAFSFGHPCVDYVIEKTLLMRDAVMMIMMMRRRRRRRSPRRRVTTAAPLEAAEGRGRIVT
jgi:hypothetical protein